MTQLYYEEGQRGSGRSTRLLIGAMVKTIKTERPLYFVVDNGSLIGYMIQLVEMIVDGIPEMSITVKTTTSEVELFWEGEPVGELRFITPHSSTDRLRGVQATVVFDHFLRTHNPELDHIAQIMEATIDKPRQAN